MTIPLTRLRTATAGLAGRTGHTPRRIRLWQLSIAAMGLMLAVVGAGTTASLTQQLEQASIHANQYLRAGDIQNQLLVAHAASARAFVAASEKDAQANDEQAVQARDTAATRIVEMAAQRTDLDSSLESLTHDLLRYAALVEAAHQQRGQDAGRDSLSQADALLRSSLLSATEELQAAHLAASQPSVGWGWVLPLVAWLTVIGLVAISVLVARASHRVFNTGLVAAALVALLIAFGSISTASAQASPNATTDALARVAAVATAQHAGSQSYALVANTVATRRSSGDPSAELAGLLATSTTALDPTADADLIKNLTTLGKAGAAILAHARSQAWTAAERALLSADADAVAAASDAVQSQTDAEVRVARDTLRGAAEAQASVGVMIAALSVIGALLICVAGIRGLSQRLKEYR
ncbi:MAG: hypothetical protein WBP09_07370 [Propionicimonas sp.]